jgi:hypothetical protein
VTGYSGILAMEADSDATFDGLDQDDYYVWGMQTEVGKFPSSYTPNPGGAGTSVTRTADNLTLDPHTAGTNEFVLPEFFCPTCSANKITIEFDAKGQFSSSVNVPSENALYVEISGNSGTATITRNRVFVIVRATGAVATYLRDDSDVDHIVDAPVDYVDYSVWHRYKAYYDVTDFTTMELWIDGSVPVGAGYTNNAGSATLDITNCMIRIGQRFDGQIRAAFWIRNLKIEPYEF